ncbi:MAG TPA: class I SAM-dependent methyltransferase [Jatrophihabitans sp.]|uniref:class I SAM-dependent methyltransferase n=1 Tax=Jatrophihabitans sp. TaxID=1932789 RepID=UPI002E094FD1|nr:class I SAM-dependent methyltransferase [Jatrophihabitans sp.]
MPQHLFRSAVAQYARYRTGYPATEVAALAERLGLDRTATVADVGCGTGQLARPLARHAGTVIAIDPVAEMLDAGRAAAAGVGNIVWELGDATDLERLVPPGTRAATFAASFHWTDRAAVTRALDRVLAADGSIVVINSTLDDEEDPDWAEAVNEVRRGYLGDDVTETYRKAPETHRRVLAASAFSNLDSVTWEWTRDLTVDAAVGLQFTYSFSTPELFGDRAAAFAAEAREAILALHPDGLVIEPFRMEVLIAARP